MQFDIITIFPKIFDSYLKESMIKRAQAKGLLKINVHDLRKWAKGRHKQVDDRPYGGGPGMALQIQPIIKAVEFVKLKVKNEKVKIILFTPAGKQFDNKMAAKLAKQNEKFILICGRYEGIDARVERVFKNLKLKIENLSIGPYVLSGGELAAMVFVETISRQIQGVLGKEESLEEKRLGIGVPVYTRPEIFSFKKKKYSVPKILLSGHHKKIEGWREKHKKSLA